MGVRLIVEGRDLVQVALAAPVADKHQVWIGAPAVLSNRGVKVASSMPIVAALCLDEAMCSSESVGERLASEPIDAIYVSNLRRTAQTAAPLAARLGLTPTVDRDLREVHLGEWERGVFRKKVIERDPLAVRMVEETGCDGVMVGRTASSNPWIFRQIRQYLATGTYDLPTERARYDIMRTYYGMLCEHAAPDAVGKMKQFATYFTHGVRNGSKLRAEIYRATEAEQILGEVDAFFERELQAITA